MLVDFGGGRRKGEALYQTAVREFVEETETLFLCDDVSEIIEPAAWIEPQTRLMQTLFDRTQDEHPDWWCQRCYSESGRSRIWKTYFVEVEYQELDDINRAWEQDTTGRFRKRRELLWLPAHELLDIYDCEPEKLWIRLRQLGSARTVIRSICLNRETAPVA